MNVKNLVLSVAACALAGSAFAAQPPVPGNNDNAQGSAGAEISCALTIDNTDTGVAPNDDLEFGGWFLQGGTNGTIVLNPCTSVATPSGANITPDPSTYTPSAANFDVDGEDGEGIELTIAGVSDPAGQISITNGGADPEDTLIINQLTICAPVARCPDGGAYTAGAPPVTGFWTSTIGGTQGGCHCNDFDLGGTLNVETNSNGRYTGLFDATVIYS